MSARARARRSARAASFVAFCAASARRARKSEVRYGLLLDMVLISDQLAEPNGSSKCRYRGSGLHMVIGPRAREASVQISPLLARAGCQASSELCPVSIWDDRRASGSRFLTAQKIRGRAHRF